MKADEVHRRCNAITHQIKKQRNPQRASSDKTRGAHELVTIIFIGQVCRTHKEIVSGRTGDTRIAITSGEAGRKCFQRHPCLEIVNLHVYRSRMTWRSAPSLCLIIFLSLTKTSEENCKDYFTQKEWENNTILKMVSLVITENKTNVAECTLESYCLQNKMCPVFHDCFDRPAKSPSEKCKPVQIVPVHTHHLMCLLARAVDSQKIVHGCEYASVCPLFEESWQDATALPPTDPKTISQVLSSRAPLPNSTPVAENGHHAENTAACQDDLSLTVPLVISSTLAIVMPLAVYFYMRHLMKQDERGPV